MINYLDKAVHHVSKSLTSKAPDSETEVAPLSFCRHIAHTSLLYLYIYICIFLSQCLTVAGQ